MGFNRELFEVLLAEATATAMLLCLGCLCTYSDYRLSLRDTMDIGWCFGLTIMTCVHCFGFISGAHINPAVSACACVLEIINWKTMLVYFAVQLLGAFVGFLLSMIVIPLNVLNEEVDWKNNTFCVTEPVHNLEIFQSIIIEFCMTVVLLFAHCIIWDERNMESVDSVSIRIGLTFVGLVYAAGYYTGCSLNLFRTLVPSLIQQRFETIWHYVVAHVAAAVVAPFFWRYVLSSKKDKRVSEPATRTSATAPPRASIE